MNLTGIPANTWVYHIEASVHGKGTAYAVFDGHTHGDLKPYALKTTDYGKTWKNIISDHIEGNAFVRNIQEDYENENLLFLGTEFGLYVTIDGGNNWSKFTNNMPAAAIHFIDMQKKTNDIVMGTHGRGVIIIDDISPLRELSQEVLTKDVHFFKAKPFTMVEESGFAGSFGAETQFVGRNRSTSARIIYYLKKRHTFGKMKMEVQDMDGNKITSLSPGKSKGINIVTWNFISSLPKMAEGKTLAFGGFTPKRVPAGKYKVVLTKGKKTYEHIVEVEYDSSSLTTMAERKEQEQYTNTLFNMVEDLAYMVYEINETKKTAQDIIDNHPRGKKSAQRLYDALEDLRKDLVITTGDNYVASADPELRERMGDLYSGVAGTYDGVSAARKENFKLIAEEFEKEKDRYTKIMAKEGKKFMSYLAKNDMAKPIIKTREEFLDKK
jgi:hypothetical protein